MVNFVRRGTMLDDAPWTWGSTGGWSQGMPSFFGDVATATKGSEYPLMYNVWDDLDTDPHTWTYMAEVRFAQPQPPPQTSIGFSV